MSEKENNISPSCSPDENPNRTQYIDSHVEASQYNKNTYVAPLQMHSIINFSYDEIRNIDKNYVNFIDIITLLKILAVRGNDSHNPALLYGAQRLLRQLNFEIQNENICKSNIIQSPPKYAIRKGQSNALTPCSINLTSNKKQRNLDKYNKKNKFNISSTKSIPNDNKIHDVKQLKQSE